MLPRHTRGNRPVPSPCRNGPRLCRNGLFFIFPVRVAAVEIIDCLYVVHRPVDVFGGILFGVGYACQVVGMNAFTPCPLGLVNASTGAGGGRRTIVFSAFPLPDGNQGGLCPPQSSPTVRSGCRFYGRKKRRRE